jgi:hypothetical protein
MKPSNAPGKPLDARSVELGPFTKRLNASGTVLDAGSVELGPFTKRLNAGGTALDAGRGARGPVTKPLSASRKLGEGDKMKLLCFQIFSSSSPLG